MTRYRLPLAVVLALALPVLLAALGVSRGLGAHPFWAFQTAIVGAPVGCVLGLALMRTRRGILAGAALLAVSGVTAWMGKARFTASYAEDALAGKLWYFGWIGVAAGLALLLVALIAPPGR